MDKSTQQSNGLLASSQEEDYSNVRVEEVQLGVWKLKLASEPNMGFSLTKQWASFKASFLLFWKLSIRVFTISPRLFSAIILCRIWSGIEPSLTLQLSSNLLRVIEERITTGKSNGREIISATALRLVCALFDAYSQWYSKKIEQSLQTCVTRHYEFVIIETNLGVDLPGSKAGLNKIEVPASEAWWSIQNILETLTVALKLVTELLLILHLSLSTGGAFFGFLCLLQPLYAGLFEGKIWTKAVFGFVDNPHYRRMKSLEKMVLEDKYKEDLISGGLGRWILDAFRQATQKLGLTSDAYPLISGDFNSINQTSFRTLLLKILGELPMLFCTFNVLLHPERFPVSSLAILQQSAEALRNSVTSAIYQGNQFRRSLGKVEKIYQSKMIDSGLKSGDMPYPRGEKVESVLIAPRKGMSFQLKNISFSYIGTQSETPALKNISLIIKPGQVVVIVGANGSGKSTLIRILSRLYDPTAGEVFIDELPSKDYQIEDLHRSTVLLSQDSKIYPLSLGENIGLGFPECASDAGMVSEAAKLGGARDFIKKLKEGMNTTLDPFRHTFDLNIQDQRNHPLNEEMRNYQKTIDISGGERQRVVASRSFMRFNSGKVKFVAVDEPSSALDAEGELQLFNNLLGVREGKTMVFVTHRFGHLTKHADLIICMKEGSIVESGTHTELMEKKGEYLSLYNIQAEAFRD